MATYRAGDDPVVERWSIDQFEEGRKRGTIFNVREDGDILYITPASGKEIRLTKEHAVVMAEDILAKYATEVGTITREP